MPVQLKITSQPFDLSRYPSAYQAQEAARRALTAAATRTQEAAQANIQAQMNVQDTGPDSFFGAVQVQMDAANLSARVGSDHPGARAQEFGAEIDPVHAQFLHFFAGGQEIFTKHVSLPARPWLGPAADQSGVFMQQAALIELKRMVNP